MYMYAGDDAFGGKEYDFEVIAAAYDTASTLIADVIGNIHLSYELCFKDGWAYYSCTKYILRSRAYLERTPCGLYISMLARLVCHASAQQKNASTLFSLHKEMAKKLLHTRHPCHLRLFFYHFLLCLNALTIFRVIPWTCRIM